jgi:phosphoribosylaminoimidazole-succinocarboxamide synthase
MYDLGDALLMVASDRLSAFDVVLPTPIPDKGRVLTQLSLFWFEKLRDVVSNHVLSATDFTPALDAYRSQLEGRAIRVRKTEPLPVECVVRGYLCGSGWKDYQATGAVCGIALPPGLQDSSALPEPIFAPATKATSGHDENISFEQAAAILGRARAAQVREVSLEIYRRASQYARERGIIIADTKFEFGLSGDELIWIDEALTPDSSRFWPAAEYAPGRSQASFDKQFVRDYLERMGWNKQPPGPDLPAEVVAGTQGRYREAYRLLTGLELS